MDRAEPRSRTDGIVETCGRCSKDVSARNTDLQASSRSLGLSDMQGAPSLHSAPGEEHPRDGSGGNVALVTVLIAEEQPV